MNIYACLIMIIMYMIRKQVMSAIFLFEALVCFLDPPMFLEPMQDTTVKNYGQCCVSCSVDGIPYPDVRFMKEWRPLSELSRFTVQQSLDDIHKWTLTIDNAISADAGTYMCAAENVAGKAYCSGRITVGGKL